jgi:two-component system, LytTR family, response regulator AlgR
VRILVVDDEPPARARLRSLIERESLGEVVGEAEDGRQALELVNELRPQLVLLDIRMPVMDGLEAARHLGQDSNGPAVVFTTAYQEHALEAFETGALDYLLKPVRAARLIDAIGRARRVAPSQLPPPMQARTHLSTAANGGIRLVAVEDVRVLRAQHKYVTAVFPGGELVMEESIAALESEFGERFLRVHRNALVACDHVTGLSRHSGGGVCVKLSECEDCVEVSRRLSPSARKRFRG